MSSRKRQSQVSLNELITGADQLEPADLERFVTDVLTLRAKRIAPCLPDEEGALLEKINQGLSPEAQKRFELLTAKRQSASLTGDELNEFIQLTDQIERVDAERAQSLSKLAWLRRVSLRTLMAELGLHAPDYA